MTTDRSMRRKYIIAIIPRWLALTLIGWLTYSLGRALGAMIFLGAPLFDWQWYLAIIISLIVIATRITWQRSRSLFGIPVFSGLLVWVAVGYTGFWQEIQLDPARNPPVPISFWARSETTQAPDHVLQDLHAAGGKLYLSLSKQGITENNRQSLIDGLWRLAEHDIEVYLAVRASDFLSVPVNDEWITNVQEAAALVQQEGFPNVLGIIGDAERPKNTQLGILGSNQNDFETFSQAVDDLAGLIRWMEVEHPDLSIGVTSEWPQYFDHIDGDSDLSFIRRSPVDPPGNWDFINLMTYSSYLPSPSRAYYVYLLERAMARLYPALHPGHLIGLAAGGPEEPILDFDDLVRDARLTRAMGVQEIVVYRYNGATEIHGEDFIRQFATAVNDIPSSLAVRVPFSRPASIFIYSALALDSLVDAFSWRGVLWLWWAMASAFIAFFVVQDATRKQQ